jgi:hypothetical protein
LSTYVPGVRVVLALAASLTARGPAMRTVRALRGLATDDWLTPTVPTVVHSTAVTKRTGLMPRTKPATGFSTSRIEDCGRSGYARSPCVQVRAPENLDE